jgi:hypothetical protein
MLKRLKKYWSDLKRGEPGSRFEEQYEKSRGRKRSGVGRVLRVASGLVLIPAGLFFLAVPGPGLLIMLFGAVLIAREFEFAARALDAMELRGRQLAKWAQRRWQKLVRARRAV